MLLQVNGGSVTYLYVFTLDLSVVRARTREKQRVARDTLLWIEQPQLW
jgi:hypothetical protein